ncbi:outer membrane lipoprotein chaperone LolA [Alteromonas pelagimontana]|uniref:Outer-membrane lipoprotein carrier protein n=1 Tax=Alteromonas pelagimontana TaxID=1858656 RepID=A0A6M4M853_9ALTE|nr:outer membrane lipoprotein chaperone LolA [Alteromonas pelagimontana]QJR79343.1 outer membrane lipoprotein chaperone LolA [Alteromonas pelagimontana]
MILQINELCALCFIAAASLPAVSATADEDARDALKETLSHMQQYQANFKQIVTDSTGEVVHQATGSLTMARPDKLKWQTQTPDETLLVADGAAVWNVDTFVEQVTVISQDSAVADNPIILLTNSEDAVWNKFTINKLSTRPEQFLIKPADGEGQIRELVLTFKDGTMQRLTMLDAQEQQSELDFSNIDTAFSLPADFFKVKIPASYMVDDQR